MFIPALSDRSTIQEETMSDRSASDFADAGPARTLHAAQPHGDGADDPQPGRRGERPHATSTATYYAQRASAGLIVTEATQVSPQGVGYPGTPGIHSDAQVAGWRQVTDAVHARGGRIFLQLWHVGRISHPLLQPGGGAAGGAVGDRGRGASLHARGAEAVRRPRARWRPTRSPAWWSSSPTAPGRRWRPASTASRSTAPTAT